MKTIYRVVLLIFILYHPSINAKEFSGVWATDCDSTKKISPLWIIRASSNGLYQVGHPRIKMSNPTPIIGDTEFEIINDEKLIYKNIEYTRCIKSETPEYSPVSVEQIKKHLLGEWRVKYQERAGRKNNISDGRSGVPDFTFIDEERATVNLKEKVNPITYVIMSDTILLKFEEGQTFKVLSINEKELHIAVEKRPSAGILVYYKYIDGKLSR